MARPDKGGGPGVTQGRPNVESPPASSDVHSVQRELLALSDALDTSLRLRLAAWRDGYACGRADGEEAGYLRAIAEVKRLHRDVREALALELRRWPPRGRYAFGQPREGDFTGRGDAA